MDAALTPLTEGFGTAINLTLKWFLSGVSKVMFYQVLLEGEPPIALVTHPLFVDLVNLHVPLQTILGFERFATPQDVTSEPFIT